MGQRDHEAFSAWTVGAVAMALLTVGLAAVAASQTGTVAQARATTWVEASSNPVHDPVGGKASDPSVALDEGTYRMWFTGTSAGFGLETSTSTDGVTWSAPEDASEGLAWVNDHAHVERIGDHYRVWYRAGSVFDADAIRTATSTDGVTWEDDRAIQQVEGDVVTGESSSGDWNSGVLGLDEVLYNPAGADAIVDPEDPESVLQNAYIGFFGTTTGGEGYVGLAVSADGVTWEAYRDGLSPVFEPSGDGWDATHVYPSTVAVGEGFHLWYSGGEGSIEDGIGYAHSSNLVDWERAEDPIFHADDGEPWRTEATHAPDVLAATGQMWFTGEDASGQPAVGAAQGLPLAGLS